MTARPTTEPGNAEARVSSLEAQSLCTFIRQTTELDPHRKPGSQLALLLQSIFQTEATAILDADLREVYQAGGWFDDLDEVLQNVCLFETASDDPETGLVRRVLRMGKLPIGAMLLRGEISPTVSDAIASVIAITFDRYHAFANESRTESARKTEQLRTTVLDSLAHAYKTPLTAIEAASGGLAAMGHLTPAQAGLVALIEEQAEQLNQLTNRLLKTARLEGSELVPQMTDVAIAPLIEDVVASLQEQMSGFSVKIAISRDDMSIRGDRSLLVALLTQYLDNAAKYAHATSDIMIQAVEESNAIVLSVQNVGPVIPAVDHDRIFDRYFRSAMSASKAPGTGIGLSIAKRAAQAHGGHVWVTSEATGGTTFFASLPKPPESDASA